MEMEEVEEGGAAGAAAAAATARRGTAASSYDAGKRVVLSVGDQVRFVEGGATGERESAMDGLTHGTHSFT